MKDNEISIPSTFTLSKIKQIFTSLSSVKLDLSAVEKIQNSRNVIENIIKNSVPVYGVNTGFGKLANVQVNNSDLDMLQLNLIRSHTAGTGDELPSSVIKLALLLLVNSLSKGHSGVRLELIEKLLLLFNSDFVPVVPKYGSLGASGDLIPLSHLVSSLLDEYPVRDANQNFHKKLSDVAETLVLKGGLKAKEGLALINGTHFTTATTVVSILGIIGNIKHSLLGFSIALDAILGSTKPFREEIHSIRPQIGQVWTAKVVRSLIQGSMLAESHEDPVDDPRVQDPYSFRCFPQVMGGVLQALRHAKEVLETEMGCVTDNPLVFSDTNEILSGGNFHAEPVAMVADYLAIAVTNLMGIMEKQIEKLLNPAHNYNLPAFLSPNAGLNSGYMIAHFGQAALLNRAILLSKPSSVDNISTSANQEDFVSMGMNSALKLYELNELFTDFLCYYLLMAGQALELRKEMVGKESSPINEKVLQELRKHVPKMIDDRQIEPDLKTIKGVIQSKNFLQVAEVEEFETFYDWL